MQTLPVEKCSTILFFFFFFFNIILLIFFISSIGLSYKNLFRQLSEERSSDYYYERGFMYDPNALDDPG